MMRRRFPEKNNILLVNITRLGDMLQATPTIAGMKMENPNAKITVVVEKQFEDICKVLPNIDEVHALDLGMTVRSLAREGEGILDAYQYISEMIDELKEKNFDYCLNMSSSAYTALMLNMLGIPRRGGWTSDAEGYRVIESDWARLFATSVFHNNRQYNSLNLVDVFRCSADVEQHPNNLLINIDPDALRYVEGMLSEFNFTNDGPLIAVQAGASQTKRQWLPPKFVKLVKQLTEEYNCRVVLTGTNREMPIIQPIKDGVGNDNVAIVAGKTNLAQLAALLSLCSVTLTGDTGTMHMSIAAGTPVVAMFLASAYGFETGPYSAGNLVLQPVITCGPCNPNKGCARPDCHETITPEELAKLTVMRAAGDVNSIEPGLVDARRCIVYRTVFDEFGFYDMQPLNNPPMDRMTRYRNAYRRMWLDDIAGLKSETWTQMKAVHPLEIRDDTVEGIEKVIAMADQGSQMIDNLVRYIKDPSIPADSLRKVNDGLSELDILIEKVGYHFGDLGPLTRMFVFAKENISGTDALALASQMGAVYSDLGRRSKKLAQYYQTLS